MAKSLLRGTQRWWPVFLGVLALIPHLMGCGLFDIRSPVTGDGGAVCPRVNPEDPDSVLVNFAQAIACKLDGMGIYEESLAEAFHLTLDPFDLQELRELREAVPESLDWVTDVESQRKVSETADSLFFEFLNAETFEERDTTAFYLDIPYELHLIRQEGDSLFLKGKADLSLVSLGAGIWALTRWVDKREDPYTSFGRWHADRAIFTSPRPGAGP